MKRIVILLALLCYGQFSYGQQTQKPVLHGKNWMAITGKPLAATAGAMTFQKGGNAVDAACAMLAATCTMWDVLSWGGETQALIYNPKTKKVIAINALGVAPSGATVYEAYGYVRQLGSKIWINLDDVSGHHDVYEIARAHGEGDALFLSNTSLEARLLRWIERCHISCEIFKRESHSYTATIYIKGKVGTERG
jgi:hypothetical protein